MNSIKKKIFIASGGTGGHIFPSLSLANFLKEENNVIFFTDKRGFKYLNNINKIEIKIIYSDTIFNKNIIKSIFGFFKTTLSFLYSFAIIIMNRPHIVIGMGGYSSFPVCLAAFFLRVPIFIYENNLVIGRANKFLLPIAKKVLVSTNNVKGIKDKYSQKVHFCGYLIRDEILTLKNEKSLKTENENLSILIMGGSQSAKVFGEVLPDIIIKCFKNDIKFKVYQQCLDDQIKSLSNTYEKFKIDFELFSFSKKISSYYRKIDLAITRSGASSLAELVNLRIPFIAIPLPFSTDRHQQENAKFFSKKGYCFLVEQEFISNKLFEILEDLNKNKKKLFLMKKKMEEHSDKNTFLNINNLIKKI